MNVHTNELAEGVGSDNDVALLRVFLEVDEPAALAAELERGAVVPTRAALTLGARFLLAVRVRGSRRAIEVPVVVVARRLPRGAHRLLSTSVIARAEDPQHPMMALLRDVASGRVVDFEPRLQAAVRLPARASFASVDEALTELRALIASEAEGRPAEGRFALPHAQRGDRLSLTVSGGRFAVATIDVIVRRVAIEDDHRTCAVTLVDERSRAILEHATRPAHLHQPLLSMMARRRHHAECSNT